VLIVLRDPRANPPPVCFKIPTENRFEISTASRSPHPIAAVSRSVHLMLPDAHQRFRIRAQL
jgi:hypothetical protein